MHYQPKRNQAMPKKLRNKKPQNEKEEIEESLGNYQALDAIYAMEGGKLLVENLLLDVINVVEVMTGKPAAISHIEYIELAIKMKERLELARILVRAPKNKFFFTEELKRILKEEEEGVWLLGMNSVF